MVIDPAQPAHETREPAYQGLRAGQLVADKYRIERLIGRGGMGIVLQAAETGAERRVAIKVLLRSERRNREAVGRFLREAQAASAIRNEHGVRILDVGKLPTGAPFLVMEYLEGVTVAQQLQSSGPFAIPHAVDVLLQACEAIAEAHSLGIVHRDLKSSNLFLTQRADDSVLVKVLDFGISKTNTLRAGEESDELTGTTEMLGTPFYMSPEQLRSTKRVDERTDIWSLGVVLYELLTARQPFWADNLPDLCAKIENTPPIGPRAIRIDLPPALERVVLWCLEKDPARRPQRIAELADALLPFASQETQSTLAPLLIRRPVSDALDDSDSAPTGPLRPSIPGSTLRKKIDRLWDTTQQRVRKRFRGGLWGVVTGTLAGAAATVGLWLHGPWTHSATNPVPQASISAQASRSAAPFSSAIGPLNSIESAAAPPAPLPASASASSAATPPKKPPTAPRRLGPTPLPSPYSPKHLPPRPQKRPR